ncbi:MAG: HEAT repeat domain-containing protein [Candidatus Marinimicrobia bacterium]|nr:HEAT repeat domain-containing protein [Candidatus Neomarinimicrobiota bacterium]
MIRSNTHTIPGLLSSLRRMSATFGRGLLLATLALSMSGCFLFNRAKDEVTVEKLRLQYQKGKMGALLSIIEIYEDTEQPQSVRLAAAEALGESRHPTALEALGKTVRDAEALNLDMMLETIDVLSRIPSPASAEALTQALTTTDAKLAILRNKLAEALEKIGSEDHIQTLIDLYQVSAENHLRMEQTITRALGNMGDERAIPFLMKLATDSQVDLAARSTAIELLAKKDSPEVVQMFAEMLGNPTTNMQLRKFALSAMGDIKEERLVLALLETYQLNRGEYYSLLNTLLTALDEFDDPAIKPTLLEIAISDDFPFTFRERAITNLANFNDPEVLSHIIPLLENHRNYHLLGTITALAEALQPGALSQERIRRAAHKAAIGWAQGNL